MSKLAPEAGPPNLGAAAGGREPGGEALGASRASQLSRLSHLTAGKRAGRTVDFWALRAEIPREDSESLQDPPCRSRRLNAEIAAVPGARERGPALRPTASAASGDGRHGCHASREG